MAHRLLEAMLTPNFRSRPVACSTCPKEGSRHVFSASWCSFVMLLPRDCAPDGEFFSEPKASASNSRIDRLDHGAAHQRETDQKHICSICKQEGHNKRTCTQNTNDHHPALALAAKLAALHGWTTATAKHSESCGVSKRRFNTSEKSRPAGETQRVCKSSAHRRQKGVANTRGCRTEKPPGQKNGSSQ